MDDPQIDTAPTPGMHQPRPITLNGKAVEAILDERKTQARFLLNPQPEFLQVYDWQGERIYDASHRSWCWRGKVHGRYPDEYLPSIAAMCPYGQPGEQLYVREQMDIGLCPGDPHGAIATPAVKPTGAGAMKPGGNPRGHTFARKWTRKSAIHMPRWAARLFLELTDVRVQLLQDISEEDAQAEGVNSRWIVPLAGGPTPDFDGRKEVDGFMKFGEVVNDLQRGKDPGTFREGFKDDWDARHEFHPWTTNKWESWVWALTFKVVRTEPDLHGG